MLNLKDSSHDQNLVVRVMRRLTPADLPWASIYWIFTVSALGMVVVLLISKFPKVQYTAEERVGSLDMYQTLARQRVVWLYFAGDVRLRRLRTRNRRLDVEFSEPVSRL